MGLISNNLALLSLSLNDFLAQYVEFYLLGEAGCVYVMPQGFANWLFGIPAVIYFPVRILMSQGSVDLLPIKFVQTRGDLIAARGL
ncbi:hypothetical protein ACOBV9_18885 (plasmid) [Pseudoalteromonas espejiana]